MEVAFTRVQWAILEGLSSSFEKRLDRSQLEACVDRVLPPASVRVVATKNHIKAACRRLTDLEYLLPWGDGYRLTESGLRAVGGERKRVLRS